MLARRGFAQRIGVNEGGHPVGLDWIKGNFEEGNTNLDLSVSDNHCYKVFIIVNSKAAKSNDDTLYWLLEMSFEKISNYQIISFPKKERAFYQNYAK